MTRPALLTILLFLLPAVFATAQGKKQETELKREVTLYNPYKPSLPEIRKMSFLPDMADTVKIKQDFKYTVSAKPFQPVYTISPIKAAALLPEPLPKLYKSYISLGFGNHTTPLAEISITNERSKKGAFGFYGRHYSTNDYLLLRNGKRAWGGYMDNDASLFGKRFFQKSQIEGSVDFTQKVRYAYGYDPAIMDYDPKKNDIRMNYSNIGGKLSYSSINMDSTELWYDFDAYYNYFHQSEFFYQHNFGLDGIMAKEHNGFYIGSGLSFVYYNQPDSATADNDFIASVSPFMKKRTDQWNFKLGLQLLYDRNSIIHIYPDLEFGFSIIQSYLGFFASLSGRMERNEPLRTISENPYLVANQFPSFVSNGTLYKLPDTDYKLVFTSGIKGNTGNNGTYLLSASYSVVDRMLFYTNVVFPDTVLPRAMGNYFLPMTSEVNLLNFHGAVSTPLSGKLTLKLAGNYYKYDTDLEHAWNKPSWDGQLGLKYNLRDKIIAGLDFYATGKRWQIVNGDVLSFRAHYNSSVLTAPEHFGLNLSAEYRYSKILSFWTRVNNISFDNYYEWAYYPAQKFIFMAGFTYSL